MGRYSSVQAYADNSSNNRAVSYEQATGSSEAKKGVVKPEKVTNPYGATAGANSGDFHLYRHARSREIERMNQLDEAEEHALKDQEYEDTLEQYKAEEEKRTEKRRRKREREKEAKLRKKSLAKAGISIETAATAAASANKEAPNEEFTYVPVVEQNQQQQANETKEKLPAVAPVELPPNDGSFLEMMKRKLQEEAKAGKGSDDATSNEPPSKRRAT